MEAKKHKGVFFELDYGKDINLDNKDKKIISILGENCRISPTTIGKMIHTSKDSVRYRTNQLIKKDIYRGNIAVLNPLSLGFPVYSILIKLKNMTSEKEEKIIQYFENHPFIIWVGQTQGAFDFSIVITSKSIVEFDKLLKEIQIKLSDSIKELKVLHMTKMYSCNTIPPEFQRQTGIKLDYEKVDSSFGSLFSTPYARLEEEKQVLSMKEVLILKTIANNANLPLQDISEITKIKRDTVKNMIKDLIKKKIILAFRALINASFLKYHGYVAYFKLYPETKEAKRKEFEEYFKNSDKICFGTEASGSYYDSMVYIFAKDPLDFNRTINEIKNKFSNIIEEYNADLILKDYKFTFLPEGIISPLQNLFLNVAKHF